MKNLLLLIGILFVAGCQLEEVEDIRDLTKEEQIALLNQISEPRELGYMINYEFDSLPMSKDSAIVFQTIPFTLNAVGDSPTGDFTYRIGVYECDTGVPNPEIFRFGYDFADNNEKLNLKNASSAIVTEHHEGKYMVEILMDSDTLFGGFLDRNLCSDGRSKNTPYVAIGETIKVYGFTRDEADFVANQLNKFIPQIKALD